MSDNINVNVNGEPGATEGAPPVPAEIAELIRQRKEREAAAAQVAGQGGVVDQPQEPVQLNPQVRQIPQTQVQYETAGQAPAPSVPIIPNSGQTPQQFADQYNAAMQQNAAAATPTAGVASGQILTREQRLAQRDEKRLRGAQTYHLEATGTDALVRDLPFSDSAMILGIPSELRVEIDSVLKEGELQRIVELGQRGIGAVGLNEAAELYAKAEAIANAACIAGFIKPRLVLHEKDLVAGDPFVWLVTDVEMEDRLAFLNWANRNRQLAMSQGGAESIRNGFPAQGMASPTDSAASDPVRETTG